MKWSGTDDWVRNLEFVRRPETLVAAIRRDRLLNYSDLVAVWLDELHKFVVHDRYSMFRAWFRVRNFQTDPDLIWGHVEDEFGKPEQGNVSGRWFFFLREKKYRFCFVLASDKGQNDGDYFLQMMLALDDFYKAGGGPCFPYFHQPTLEIGITFANESDGVILEALRANIASEWHVTL